MRAFLVLALLVAPLVAASQLNDLQVVVTEKRALFVFPPKLVIGQRVESYSVSPTGRFVVALTEDLPMDVLVVIKPNKSALKKHIVIWDSASNTSKTLPLLEVTNLRTVNLVWFANTDRAVIQFQVTRVASPPSPSPDDSAPGIETLNRNYLLDPATAVAKLIPGSESWNVHSSRIDFAPNSPVAIVLFNDVFYEGLASEQSFILRLDADGALGRTVEIAKGFSLSGDHGWADDGKKYLFQVARYDRGTRTLDSRIVAFDPSTETMETLVGPVKTYEPAKVDSDLLLVSEFSESKELNRRARSWSLKSTSPTQRPVALVTEHAEEAMLAPNDGFVVLQYKGALFVSRLKQLTPQEYQAFTVEQAKYETMGRAKQCVLALLMYAADNDDVVPESFDFKNKLMPYHKNEDVMRDFVFTYQGGNLNELTNASITEIGYIQTAYGRAVAYADGHVEWKE